MWSQDKTGPIHTDNKQIIGQNKSIRQIMLKLQDVSKTIDGPQICLTLVKGTLLNKSSRKITYASNTISYVKEAAIKLDGAVNTSEIEYLRIKYNRAKTMRSILENYKHPNLRYFWDFVILV